MYGLIGNSSFSLTHACVLFKDVAIVESFETWKTLYFADKETVMVV